MSSLPPQPEAGIKQFFLWALVAGFVPVLGLPVVWGLVALGWRRQASPAFRLWSRRLLALAVLDTLVAAACLHLGTTAARNKMERDEARLGVGLMSVDASSHAPPPLRLFEPSKQDEPVLPRELGLRKEWIGTGLAMVALLVLWGVGRKRGAGRRPLEVLAVLVVAGLGALATVRGLSALFGGPSRGVLLLGVWAQGLILLFAAGRLARRGAPGPDVAAGRGWGQTYLLSLGLLITLGMRTMMLMVWLSQVSSATPEQNMHPLVEMAREGPLGVWGWVLLAVPAALLAPVSEELLFRGAARAHPPARHHQQLRAADAGAKPRVSQGF
jgi:hypothetical protein